jgi:hypothetical protein
VPDLILSNFSSAVNVSQSVALNYEFYGYNPNLNLFRDSSSKLYCGVILNGQLPDLIKFNFSSVECVFQSTLLEYPRGT